MQLRPVSVTGDPVVHTGPVTGDPAAHSPSPLPPDLDARLRTELGMPFLPTVFTLLADHPTYLRAAAEAFLARLPDALDEHDRAVRCAGACAAPSLVPSPWQVGPAASSIAALIDSYNQVNPPSLLFTLWMSPAQTICSRVMEPPLPEPPSAAGSEALLADIDICHGNFKVPGFWRELVAGWPQQTARAWALVRRLPENADFARAREAVSSLSRQRTPDGAAPAPADVGCSPAQAEEIARILAFYAVAIPTMVVEIECLRHALAPAAPRDQCASRVPER